VNKYADVDTALRQLLDIWGLDFDQVEAHLENDEFSDDEIDHALQRMKDMDERAAN
jgi:hypothetical protein